MSAWFFSTRPGGVAAKRQPLCLRSSAGNRIKMIGGLCCAKHSIESDRKGWMMKQEVPILAPISAALGIDPLHFAMIVIVNLTMGMVTPPVGRLLFVTAVATLTPIAALTRELPSLSSHN